MQKEDFYFESKMEKPFFCLFLNLCLAILVFLGAELGRLTGIANLPLAISLIWPSTGFSLAAMLLFGLNAWPGVFFGNFFYNFYHLYFVPSITVNSLIIPLLTAILVSSGSLLQALLGNGILRTFSSRGYFNTVRDMVLFLFFGGLLTCMVASSIGVTALYNFYGNMTPEKLFYTWITFWIGDALGVFTFAPLLVVWSIFKFPGQEFKKYFFEFLLMILALCGMEYLIFHFDYPFLYLYILLSLWITYRFGIHGATLSALLICISTVVPTLWGYGPYSVYHVENPLDFLVTFLVSLFSLSLLFAALVNERKLAQQQDQNVIDFHEAVQIQWEEWEDKQNEAFISGRIASLGLLTSGIVRQIEIPMERINVHSKHCLDALNRLQTQLNSLKSQLKPDEVFKFQTYCEELVKEFFRMLKFNSEAQSLVNLIKQQAVLTAPAANRPRPINMNFFLRQCLKQADFAKDFSFKLEEHYDETVKMIFALPQDLVHVFIPLFAFSMQLMKDKKKALGESYSPILQVRTFELEEYLDILIQVNAEGPSQMEMRALFSSLLSEQLEDRSLRFSLMVANDIMTRIYHGRIKAESKEGKSFTFVVAIPKFHHVYVS